MKLEKRLELYDYFHPRFLYEEIEHPELTKETALRQKAKLMQFPLSSDDRNDILRFMFIYDNRAKRSFDSMAAPQLGFAKRFIAFIVPHGRKVHQRFPKQLWINPSYEKIVDDMEEDYEVCYSVNMVPPVMRYKRIWYKAYDTKGNLIEGEAQGKAARVIQHEIDHLDGTLITDLTTSDKLMTIEDYRRMKKEAWGGKGWEHFLDVFKAEMEQLRKEYPPIVVKKKKKDPTTTKNKHHKHKKHKKSGKKKK